MLAIGTFIDASCSSWKSESLKFSEEEFEKFDEDYQFALYVLLQCRDVLKQKSSSHYLTEINSIDSEVEKLFFTIYNLRKDSVDWK